MLNGLKVALFALFLSSFILPSQAAESVDICGPACAAMQDARPSNPQPTNIGLVCIYFEQRRSGTVVLLLFGVDETLLRTISRTKEAQDRYCIGKKHWASRTARVVLCNEDDTREARGERWQQIVRQGRTSADEPVLLVQD